MQNPSFLFFNQAMVVGHPTMLFFTRVTIVCFSAQTARSKIRATHTLTVLRKMFLTKNVLSGNVLIIKMVNLSDP